METHVWNKADLVLASAHIFAWTVFWHLYGFSEKEESQCMPNSIDS